ncbi:MAG: prenyltransferase/squalene oxidase repeat-containing protein [Phycisphaeraceae bacterium]
MNQDRRNLLLALSALAGGTVLRPLLPSTFAQAAPVDAIGPKLKRDEIDDQIDKGIVYLRSKQHQNGWIGDNENYRSALTGLSVLAMLAVGHQPSDKSPEGESIRRAITFLLRPENQSDEGYFGRVDGSNMYGHGIVTLLLAELAGMGIDEAHDKLVLQRLHKAIDLTLRSQAVKKDQQYQGGWRYQPESRGSDLSISVWQVMALRSAKNAGIEVPAGAIDSAVAYLRGSYRSDRNGRGRFLELQAGFTYTPGGRPTFSSASAGMLAMQVCGQYDAEEVKGTGEWLMAMHNKLSVNEQYFYYGTYYYAQAMYQHGGKFAEHGRREVARILAPQQQKDGSWPRSEAGPVYTTGLAVLSLSVKYHYLPIYQR